MDIDHGAVPGPMEGQEALGEIRLPVKIAALGDTPPTLPLDNSVEGLGPRAYRGTSLIRKRPPPSDPPRTLGIGLRLGPGGGGVL